MTASAASVVCMAVRRRSCHPTRPGHRGPDGDPGHCSGGAGRTRFAPLAHPGVSLMARLSSLDDLLVHELQDVYNAEAQILKALPKMTKAASNPDLKAAFEEHRVQTEGQVTRLEQVFELLGMSPKGRKCEGMAGLLEEGKKVMEQDAEPSVLDA